MKKAAGIYLAIMLSVYLLAVPTGGYKVISGFKFILFASLTCAFLIAAFVYLLKERLLKTRGKVSFMRAAVILYLFFSCFSAVLSPYGTAALTGTFRYEGLITIVLYGLAFLLLSKYLKPAAWQLWLFGASVTLMCVIIFLQLQGYNPLGLYPDLMTYNHANILYFDRYVGTVGNAGLTAAVLSTAATVFITAILRFGKRTWLLLIPALLSAYILGRIEISAGILSLTTAMLLVLPAAVKDKSGLARLFALYPLLLAALFLKHMTAVMLFAPALCLGAAYFFYRLKKPVPYLKPLMWITVLISASAAFTYIWLYKGAAYGMVYEANRLLHGVWNDGFGNGRLFIWRKVWELVKKRPFFGGGPDTLGLRGLQPYIWFSEESGGIIHTYITAAHNEYLNVLANQGVFAAICFAALPFAALYKLYKIKSDAVIIASGAALCYAVEAFFGISMCTSAVYFWLLLAYADSSIHMNPVK